MDVRHRLACEGLVSSSSRWPQGATRAARSMRLVMPLVSGMSRVAKTETDSYGFFRRISRQGGNIIFDQHITDGDDIGRYDFGQ